MALSDGEVARIKSELGYNLIAGDVSLYVNGWTAIFEVAIQPYLDAGTATTSATAVTAASAYTPVALTLTSATGFASGARVVIDVDSRKETATIQNLSGTSMTVQLRLAHSGTYPVVLADSGEAIVREILAKIASVKTTMGETFGEGSIKKVDELEFYDSGSATFGSLGSQLSWWREELASTIGVPSGWSMKRSAGQSLSVY